MSPLAFDKDGQPFQFTARTHSLSVRRWRKPGARGTCEVLFDEDGSPLHVEADGTIPDLREAVGNVPGLYRLDQYDEAGNEIAGAPAAYIAIDPPRNGSPGSSTDPLVIVRDLAQMHADVSKTLADRSAGMMQAATENMRVAISGGLGNRRLLGVLANAAAAVDAPTDEDDDDDDDDDGEEGDDEDAPPPAPAQPDPWAMLRPFTPMLTAIAPKLGEVIAAKLVDLVNQLMKAGPAAAPAATTTTASATASAPSPSGATAHGAAAGQGAADAAASSPPAAGSSSPVSPAAETSVPIGSPEASAEADDVAPAQTSTGSATATMGSVMDVRNATPTGAQIALLLAIRAQLAPREVAIIDRAIAGMDEPTRAWWLGELSALTLEQAVARVRSLIPTARTRGDAGEE